MEKMPEFEMGWRSRNEPSVLGAELEGRLLSNETFAPFSPVKGLLKASQPRKGKFGLYHIGISFSALTAGVRNTDWVCKTQLASSVKDLKDCMSVFDNSVYSLK